MKKKSHLTLDTQIQQNTHFTSIAYFTVFAKISFSCKIVDSFKHLASKLYKFFRNAKKIEWKKASYEDL